MNRIRLVACAGVVMLGCGGAPEPAKSADDSKVVEQPENAPDKSAKSENPSEASSPPDELPGAPPPTNVGFDFHGWCYDHGVEASLAVDECEPAGFGKPPADAIWCARHEDSTDGVASYFQSLYVVRGKRLVRLIEVPIAAGTIAEVGKPAPDSERFKIKLTRQNSEDGKSVTFSEDPKLDCSHATEDNKEVASMDPKLGAKLGAAITKVCAARGRYAWNGATLSKVSSKP